jgi:hypothetical protein
MFNKTNNPIFKQDFVVVKSYNQFVEYVEEQFKKDGSYPGFISFDYLLSPVRLQVIEDYSIHMNDESYMNSGQECAKWIVEFTKKNNLPTPKYIIHDQNSGPNSTGRMKISREFNHSTNIVPPVIVTPVIVTPVTKTTTAETKSESQKISDIQEQYWTKLKIYLEKNGSIVKIKKSLPQYWINFPIGKSDFYISAMISSREPVLSIMLCFMGTESKSNYDKLNKKCYDSSLATINGIIWDKMDGKKMSGVYLKTNGDFTNTELWDEQFSWFMENLEKFINYFKPIIKNI